MNELMRVTAAHLDSALSTIQTKDTRYSESCLLSQAAKDQFKGRIMVGLSVLTVFYPDDSISTFELDDTGRLLREEFDSCLGRVSLGMGMGKVKLLNQARVDRLRAQLPLLVCLKVTDETSQRAS